MVYGNYGTLPYNGIGDSRDTYTTKLLAAVQADVININELNKILRDINLFVDRKKTLGAINAVAGDQGQTPLHIACKRSRLDVVEALVEAGADINAVDKDNICPLGYAASEGASDIIIYLCQFEVNPNLVRKGVYAGETPLMTAAWKCNKEAVEALINKGANVTAQADNNVTALFNAVYNTNGREEADKIIMLLIEYEAIVNRTFEKHYRDNFKDEYYHGFKDESAYINYINDKIKSKKNKSSNKSRKNKSRKSKSRKSK